ncbi:G-type lectin S-receptor-like serine/threonine-protein kinase isoform X1 [Tanacetum coccineum]
MYENAAADVCSSYELCGAYGNCDINKYPLCSCIEGFVPAVKEEWNATDSSSGCQHKERIDCGNGDDFKKVAGLKFLDTRSSWCSKSMTLGECEMACRRSCTAYANLYIRNGGTGCLIWFGGLIDIREYDEKHLYIRMAFSESQGIILYKDM